MASWNYIVQTAAESPEFPEILANLQVHNEVQAWIPWHWGSYPSNSQCNPLLALSISSWLVHILVYTKLKWSFFTHLHTDQLIEKTLFWYQNWFFKVILCHCGLCVLYFFTGNYSLTYVCNDTKHLQSTPNTKPVYFIIMGILWVEVLMEKQL